jgi:hypothetical protein
MKAMPDHHGRKPDGPFAQQYDCEREVEDGGTLHYNPSDYPHLPSHTNFRSPARELHIVGAGGYGIVLLGKNGRIPRRSDEAGLRPLHATGSRRSRGPGLWMASHLGPQATNGAKAAHTATRPNAIPAAVT